MSIRIVGYPLILFISFFYYPVHAPCVVNNAPAEFTVKQNCPLLVVFKYTLIFITIETSLTPAAVAGNVL